MRNRPVTRKLLALLALLSFVGAAAACGEEGSTDPDITGTTIPVTEAPEAEDTGGSSVAEDTGSTTEDTGSSVAEDTGSTTEDTATEDTATDDSATG
jgi:hypothetical protein